MSFSSKGFPSKHTRNIGEYIFETYPGGDATYKCLANRLQRSTCIFYTCWLNNVIGLK